MNDRLKTIDCSICGRHAVAGDNGECPFCLGDRPVVPEELSHIRVETSPKRGKPLWQVLLTSLCIGLAVFGIRFAVELIRLLENERPSYSFFDDDLFPFADIDWREFNSTEGNYRIQMPGRSFPQELDVEYGLGTISEICITPRGVFQVAFTDYTPQDVARMDVMTQEVDATVASFVVGTVTTTKIEVEGYAGYELKGEMESEGVVFQTTFRVFLVGTRLYLICVQAPAEVFVPNDITRFVNSFQLLHTNSALKELSANQMDD